MRIHVLTPGFKSPNGCAFLFPMIVWKSALSELGINVFFFNTHNEKLTDADLLIVDSKYHKDQWAKETSKLLEQFELWSQHVPVAYFDTSDSSGWVLDELLPIVDAYFKNQLFRDKSFYKRSLYGRRLHADYYHRQSGIEDSQPEISKPINDVKLINKLRVSWNSGLADYSTLGPLLMTAYQFIPFNGLLRYPKPLNQVAVKKDNDVSCRFGTNYDRQTVSWQRLEIQRLLTNRLSTNKLRRNEYMNELCRSKVIVSPFGLGEITLKDFEVFLTGGLLFKPDMSHLETWPDFFQDGVTMISHNWNLDDLEDKLEECISNYSNFVNIAEAGQELYRIHTSGEKAPEIFSLHFKKIINSVIDNAKYS